MDAATKAAVRETPPAKEKGDGAAWRFGPPQRRHGAATAPPRRRHGAATAPPPAHPPFKLFRPAERKQRKTRTAPTRRNRGGAKCRWQGNEF
jgi:hypothetical protein